MGTCRRLFHCHLYPHRQLAPKVVLLFTHVCKDLIGDWGNVFKGELASVPHLDIFDRVAVVAAQPLDGMRCVWWGEVVPGLESAPCV